MNISGRYIGYFGALVAVCASMGDAFKSSESECIAGTEFIITSVDDLKNLNDLECVYAAGAGLQTIPLGYSYGTLLEVAGSRLISDFAEPIYNGDFSVRTYCGMENVVIGWLSIGGLNPGTALWDLNNESQALPVNLADGEYPLSNRGTLIMDFTADLEELCPIDNNGVEDLKSLSNFSIFRNSTFPVSEFIDMSVAVGRDAEDGALITLNRAYLLPRNAEDGAVSILFYATKTFDPRVIGTLSLGEVITVPVVGDLAVIPFKRAGIKELLERIDIKNVKNFLDVFIKIICPNTTIPQEFGFKNVTEEGLNRFVEFFSKQMNIVFFKDFFLIDSLSATKFLGAMLSIDEENI